MGELPLGGTPRGPHPRPGRLNRRDGHRPTSSRLSEVPHRRTGDHAGGRPRRGAYSGRGRSAPESCVPRRRPRRRPVPARHVASRIGHNRVQSLERRSVHGLDASCPHRLRRTHRTPGALAFGGSGPTPQPGQRPETAGNKGPTASPAPAQIGGSHRRNGTFPAEPEERRPPANTGPLTH
jgi:hypothetical protein